MNGFTVEGPGPAEVNGSLDFGIFVAGNATLNLTSATVSDIRANPLGSLQTGVAILVGSDSMTQVGHATISGTTEIGYQKVGISVEGSGSTATLQNNIINGVAGASIIAQIGIQVSAGAVATITGNTVTGNVFTGANSGPDLLAPNNTQSNGIAIFQPGSGTSVSGNTVSGNDNGIYSFPDTVAVTLSANTLANNRFEGIVLDQGNTMVTNNKISGGNIGVALVAFAVATGNAQGTLTGNTITGTGTGIQLLDELSTDANLPMLTAHLNQIFGNTTGVANPTSGTANVDQNFWGSPTGPNAATNPMGLGAGITGNVTFTAWATSQDFTSFVSSATSAVPFSFVAALYRDVLGRAADGAGLDFWVSLMNSGSSNLQIATAFWRSPEHRGIQVDQDFTTFLHRTPSPADRMAVVNGFLAGLTETQVSLIFLTSQEYQVAHASDDAYVTGLYQDVLGHAPDSAGQAFWVGQLQNSVSRQTVAMDFLTSQEFDKLTVDGYYRTFLARAVDSVGEQFWISILMNRQGTLETVAESFLTSNEYLTMRRP